MRPFLIYGSNDKARYDYAKDVAHNNLWNFISMDSKNYKNFSKQYISSTLDSTRTVFFLNNIDKLSIKDSIDFLKLIEGSPHVFILASETLPTNYILKKSCLHKSLGFKLGKISSCLKSLMCETNRDLVRLAIQDRSPKFPIFLFHILKKNAWKSPEVIPSLIKINQNLYKVKPAYIQSLLAFAFPPKKYDTYSAKKEDNKMMKKILAKIRKSFYVSKSKAADLYLLFNRLGSVPEKAIVLSDEEKEFLGVGLAGRKEEVQTLEAPVKTSSLSEFF